ncbi:hypothetical protein CcaverHIS002_0211250 [Cutaneotrichosporon cavernicola]|uniref:Protein EFR3 n=1 Tax=Cutaneotrichosporon cavernicola TaxID=279322 RepID=A0AA48IBI1_9TREE|nr:uncharacterized protein CcaverHIS019_0211240 [Cutaneotrichosporon cavernicola]BEI81965.1 hypothetical protein CcaverHIS002_0211250 [Cutaneotrichosporon cavernicola]BEI89762.1 hypothetical protein CcaverHIS019_0211240 [Cutaneotrichosporon cavernicola]BEI97534.1 hypothetical protein CcaverHIS631_0211230 [Cutaneotrichosporon cavernicola]BEJ05312.1 hypothetical protein CcaverHIS641_0211290 [Cutaneotrichosporon cavernicola]
MGCLGCCTQLNPEIAALQDCYPPSKDLVKSSPEFMPMSQDMSKLTYYAKNKPSSLAKIGDELEKRVVKEAKASTGGYPKSRAALLISLVILYKLLTECKRDIGLFSRQALRAISAALDVKIYQTNKVDLEAISRAGNCFVALTQGTDGGSIGVDDALTSAYLEVLAKFAAFSSSGPTGTVRNEKGDDEDQSRARLLGLRGLTGASTSDAAFSSGEFLRQAQIIVPALLAVLQETPMSELKGLVHRSRRRSALGPLITEVSSRPRPPPSLSEHVVGEKGPSADDVTSAAFRCLYEFVAECHTSQASHVLDVVLVYFDKRGVWRDVERCCVITETLAQAMQLQSRFVVPTRIVELLVNMPDDQPPTDKHMSILAMVTTVLTSSVSLVGLAVTDILSSLISVIERRVALDANDALLTPLVNCVSSLGTHIYYVDQINDIVEETTLQMMSIPVTNPARQEILRVLIHCITGVMVAADRGDEIEAEARERPASPLPMDKGKGLALDSPAVEMPRARDAGRRNPIAPEVWQETLPLLCESSYPVRAAYARALIFYLQTELPRDKRPRPDEPNIVRFCQAVNAAVYTLAMSSRLGQGEPLSGPPTPSRSSSANMLGSGASTPPRGQGGIVSFVVSEPTPVDTPTGTISHVPNGNDRSHAGAAATSASANGAGTPGSGAVTPPRKPLRGGRRVSLPLNRLITVTEPGPFDAVATPFDYAAILALMGELHAAVPSAALETSAPMLFALDSDAGNELTRRPGMSGAYVLERRRAVRETLLILWRHISRSWGVFSVLGMAEHALASLPEPFVVPDPRSAPDGELPRPETPVEFVRDESEAESAAASQPILNWRDITAAFANSSAVEMGTGRDAQGITRVFGAKWSVEDALRNATERFARPAPAPEATPFMAIPNASYQSFGRPVSRAVEVGDLRDALAGGAETGSAAQSVASMSSSAPTNGAPKGKPDAKEILKEIFKEKRPRGVAASAPA